ncbi:hypothetical protein [Nocardia flavorosea]|uniref:Uncharacterized protein n=1 Tax=Nocardia flavorosea TaxID=53429 RepID=A0A846YTH1_9NOCA|nr:hypothetical protein [Nocardia flavorosea]NKY60774.1 hypothetical protein [Nocardia flavorosea]
MKVYLVHEYLGYGEEPVRHVFDNLETAEEYSRLINHGSTDEVGEWDVLSGLPERWEVWTARGSFWLDELEVEPSFSSSSEIVWEEPADVLQSRVHRRRERRDPYTLSELMEMRRTFQYLPAFDAVREVGPSEVPNHCAVVVWGVGRDRVEAACREKLAELRAEAAA